MVDAAVTLPDYLRTLESLAQHFRAQLEGLSSAEAGDKFAHFVQRLIPQTELGKDYGMPILSKNKSVDGGVDLTARGKADDTSLYAQARLAVDRAEAIDNVMSKFQAYTTTIRDTGQGILDLSNTKPHFLLVTLSPFGGIRQRYEKTSFASRAFYDQCRRDNRVHFLDGTDILRELIAAYNKINHLSTELVLNFATPCISVGNVYLGFIACAELKALHRQFGDALFFENVRDFLGLPRPTERFGRTTPNSEIVKTLTTEPEKLLSRNNGLVFGANEVRPSEDRLTLTLSSGSVVNGCQTTMCIVETPNDAGHVLAKVVQTSDAWDITKAANYQNQVPDIDLDLARYLRPQLVKRAAANLGFGIKDIQKTAFQIVNEIYDKKIAYSETRLLYIGLFSVSPNNVFASNYTELVHELVARLYTESSYEERVFDTLFQVQYASQAGLNGCRGIFDDASYAPLFERLYDDDHLPYRCYISILALCGTVKQDVSDRKRDIDAEAARMRQFLSDANAVLTSDPQRFDRVFRLAVKMWMQDMLGPEGDAETRRDMYVRTKASNFTNMCRKLRMETDLQDKGLNKR